jgi:hypothetical protein
MSDSAHGNDPRSRAKTNVSSSAQTRIEPETAERFASAFVPVWQFEDAPFDAGVLSDADIQELGAAPGGASPNPYPGDLSVEPPASGFPDRPQASFTGAAMSDRFAAGRRDEAIRTEPSVIISEEPIHAPTPSEASEHFSRVLPALDGTSPAPPQLGPHQDDGGMVLRPRHHGRFILGIGAGVAAILTSLAILFTREHAPPQRPPPPLTLELQPTRAAEDIPPPLPGVASTTSPAAETTPASEPAGESPSRTTATPSTSAAPPRAPDATHLPRNPAPPTKKPAKATGGGIVRENPF